MQVCLISVELARNLAYKFLPFFLTVLRSLQRGLGPLGTMATAAAAATQVAGLAAPAAGVKALEGLTFDNRSLRELPLDPVKENYRRKVSNAVFSRVSPTPVTNPEVVAVSQPALNLLDLAGPPAASTAPAPAEGKDAEAAASKSFAEYFSGNKVLPGAEPSAHCYCGHQFGYFSGQLGDGATMYLGEVLNSRGNRVELQFKGAGKTPYSRTADGRKVLRSSLREFLCSELMHSLGIPTTRAGTVVTSDTRVQRDIFYSGDVIQERATIITRLAPSFFRFGSFEIARKEDAQTGREGPSAGNWALLQKLLEYTCRHFYPAIYAAAAKAAAGGVTELQEEGRAVASGHGSSGETPVAVPPPPSSSSSASSSTAAGAAAGGEASSLPTALPAAAAAEAIRGMYAEAVRRTAFLAAHWQAFGWAHGVLNTDNMSILGLTIDYGPFGFLDQYDPDFICNASDDQGRYSFKNQPSACRWNCVKLGETISQAPCFTAGLAPAAAGKEAGEEGAASSSLSPFPYKQIVKEVFDSEFERSYFGLMAAKLGLGVKDGAAAGAVSAADLVPTAGYGSLLESGLGYLPSASSRIVPNVSAEDRELINKLLSTMEATGADYTNTFRALMQLPLQEAVLQYGAASETVLGEGGAPRLAEGFNSPISSSDSGASSGGSGSGFSSSSGIPSLQYAAALQALLNVCASARTLAAAKKPEVSRDQLLVFQQMHAARLLPSQKEAIAAEMKKWEEYERLSQIPEEQKREENAAKWRQWLQSYCKRLLQELQGKDTSAAAAVTESASPSTSNSTAFPAELSERRQRLMSAVNPRFILRNWIAQRVIDAAEAGDFSEAQKVLQLMQDPFALQQQQKEGQVQGEQQQFTESAEQSGHQKEAEAAAQMGTCGCSVPQMKGKAALGHPSASEGAGGGGACGGTAAVSAGGALTVDYSSGPPEDLRDLKVT